MSAGSVKPSVSVPRVLARSYAEAPGVAPLSSLLQAAMAAELLRVGAQVPPPAPPDRLTKARAARWSKTKATT